MLRFLSIFIACVFFASAVVEIASFAIDHRSWIAENVRIARDWLVPRMPALPFPGTGTAQCEEVCTVYRSLPPTQDCDSVEPLAKKVMCRLTLPEAERICVKKECRPTPDKSQAKQGTPEPVRLWPASVAPRR
jgi:hypothetical protein